MRFSSALKHTAAVILLNLMLTGCVGTVVGAAVDTAVEVIKIPFKVGGAVIDVVTPDDFNESSEPKNKSSNSEQAALQQESEAL